MTGNDATGLTAERVQFADSPLSWREAIALVAQPLIQDGTVEPSYADSVVATALKMGPYFDFGRGIAMPHARPEGNVAAVGLSFLRVRQPVLLLDDEKHPIDVFIMLAAPDDSSHLAVLKNLAGVLTDPTAVEAMKAATTPGEVLSVFGQGSN